MTQQLRIYKLNPELKQQFLNRFKNHAIRIMESYGLVIGPTWVSGEGESLEFVYLIEAENEDVLISRLNSFLADEEWTAIKKHTAETLGEMVLGKEERILKTIDLKT